MERTKPINQNFKQKKPSLLVHHVLLKVLRPKTNCPSFPTETKYKEITTLKLLLIYAFFSGGSYVTEKLKQLVNHGAEKSKRNKTSTGKPVI